MMGLPSKQTYVLECELCGSYFECGEGFPKPQLCNSCLHSLVANLTEDIEKLRKAIKYALRTGTCDQMGHMEITPEGIDKLDKAWKESRT